MRILSAFDPRRQAILLVAGDKPGTWNKWYAKSIPIADSRFEDHMNTLDRVGPIARGQARRTRKNP